MNDCLFCKIINNEIPSYKVYEDADTLAFLDISQGTLGHTLVLPKVHYDNILEIDEEALKKCIVVAKKIALAVSKLPNVKGVNIINNCKEMAGQTINHFHIHVIPRYNKEELPLDFITPHKLSVDEFNKLKEEINIG